MRNLLALALLLLATNLEAAKTQLNLYIWSEYIDPGVVKDFETQFDCKVNMDLYEDVERMLDKVDGGGVALYVVVVPADHAIPAMVKRNLLAPLRDENIPNLRNLDERFLNPPYDCGNQYTVAYAWGTVGVFARPTPGRPLPQSWSILFDAQGPPRSFLLIDSVRDLVGAALIYKGHSANSTDPNQLREARDLAEKFINFLLDARVAARNSNFIRYSSPNQAAMEFIRPDDRDNPALYPTPDLRAHLEFLQDLGPKTRLYDEVWTQIKAK